MLWGSQPLQDGSQDAFLEHYEASQPQQASRLGQRSPARFRSCSQPNQAPFAWPEPAEGTLPGGMQLGQLPQQPALAAPRRRIANPRRLMQPLPPLDPLQHQVPTQTSSNPLGSIPHGPNPAAGRGVSAQTFQQRLPGPQGLSNIPKQGNALPVAPRLEQPVGRLARGAGPPPVPSGLRPLQNAGPNARGPIWPPVHQGEDQGEAAGFSQQAYFSQSGPQSQVPSDAPTGRQQGGLALAAIGTAPSTAGLGLGSQTQTTRTGSMGAAGNAVAALMGKLQRNADVEVATGEAAKKLEEVAETCCGLQHALQRLEGGVEKHSEGLEGIREVCGQIVDSLAGLSGRMQLLEAKLDSRKVVSKPQEANGVFCNTEALEDQAPSPQRRSKKEAASVLRDSQETPSDLLREGDCASTASKRLKCNCSGKDVESLLAREPDLTLPPGPAVPPLLPQPPSLDTLSSNRGRPPNNRAALKGPHRQMPEEISRGGRAGGEHGTRQPLEAGCPASVKRRRVMKENVAPEGPAATRPGRPQSRNIPVRPEPLMGPTDPKHPGDARPSLGMARAAAGTTRMAHFSSAMAGNTGCTVSDAAEPFERLGRMEARAPRGAEEAAASGPGCGMRLDTVEGLGESAGRSGERLVGKKSKRLSPPPPVMAAGFAMDPTSSRGISILQNEDHQIHPGARRQGLANTSLQGGRGNTPSGRRGGGAAAEREEWGRPEVSLYQGLVSEGGGRKKEQKKPLAPNTAQKKSASRKGAGGVHGAGVAVRRRPLQVEHSPHPSPATSHSKRDPPSRGNSRCEPGQEEARDPSWILAGAGDAALSATRLGLGGGAQGRPAFKPPKPATQPLGGIATRNGGCTAKAAKGGLLRDPPNPVVTAKPNASKPRDAKTSKPAKIPSPRRTRQAQAAAARAKETPPPSQAAAAPLLGQQQESKRAKMDQAAAEVEPVEESISDIQREIQKRLQRHRASRLKTAKAQTKRC